MKKILIILILFIFLLESCIIHKRYYYDYYYNKELNRWFNELDSGLINKEDILFLKNGYKESNCLGCINVKI